MTVGNIFQQKGPKSLDHRSRGRTRSLSKMVEKDVGSLVVMDCEKFVGIITERHYSRNCTHCTRDRIEACDPRAGSREKSFLASRLCAYHLPRWHYRLCYAVGGLTDAANFLKNSSASFFAAPLTSR